MEELAEIVERSREIAHGWLSFYWGRTIEEFREEPDDFRSAFMARWLTYFPAAAPSRDP